MTASAIVWAPDWTTISGGVTWWGAGGSTGLEREGVFGWVLGVICGFVGVTEGVDVTHDKLVGQTFSFVFLAHCAGGRDEETFAGVVDAESPLWLELCLDAYGTGETLAGHVL
jgi:hypothetical protein